MSDEMPRIEKLDPALDRLIALDAEIETLAQGYDWSEGPVWVRDGGFLLFSDIPRNMIVRWDRVAGARQWLKPSGYTGREPRGGELGSNALLIDAEGRLVICQHGDRRIAQMQAPLSAPEPRFSTLADRYRGARFNSPNDAVFGRNGDLYFTDPPYGMVEQFDDPARELAYQGVFRRHPDATISLLTSDMTRPNGLAFSPDEKALYVSQSDPSAPLWRAFAMRPDGSLGANRILFDASSLATTRSGLPDGLKVDTDGNLFATGPGGVLILTPEGQHVGTILTGQVASNCAFGDDGHSLFITAGKCLLRVRVKAIGLGF